MIIQDEGKDGLFRTQTHERPRVNHFGL